MLNRSIRTIGTAAFRGRRNMVCCRSWLRTSLLLGWLLAVPASAMPLLELTAPVSMLPLASSMERWCDGTADSTLDSVQDAPFVAHGANQIVLGYRDDACWFRRSEERRVGDE